VAIGVAGFAAGIGMVAFAEAQVRLMFVAMLFLHF
jgi:hypothetical protein